MRKLEEHDAEILRLLNLSGSNAERVSGVAANTERLWFFTYSERVHRYNIQDARDELWLPKSSPLMKDKNHCKELMENVKGLGTNEIRDCTLFYIDAVKVTES